MPIPASPRHDRDSLGRITRRGSANLIILSESSGPRRDAPGRCLQGVSRAFTASSSVAGPACVLALVFVHLLTCLGELLVRDMEALTRSTHALDARVLLHLLACQGEAVARVVEQLTSLTHTLHRRVELVRRVGHDVFVLASLREGVHDAEHAQPVPLTPVPQPVLIWNRWPWASARGRRSVELGGE